MALYFDCFSCAFIVDISYEELKMTVFKGSLWETLLVEAPGHSVMCCYHTHICLNESLQGSPVTQGPSMDFSI